MIYPHSSLGLLSSLPSRASKEQAILLHLDHQGRILSVSGEEKVMLAGDSLNGLFGRSIGDVYVDENGSGDWFAGLSMQGGSEPMMLDLKLRDSDSEIRRMMMRSMQGADGVTWLLESESQVRQEIEELGSSLSLLVEHSGMGIVDMDFQYNNAMVSPAFWGMIGSTDEEPQLAIHRLVDLIHPEDRAIFDPKFSEELDHLGAGRQGFKREVRFKHQDQVFRWAEIKGLRYLKKGGECHRMIFFFEDITIRHLIEDNLQESEERFNLLVNSKTIGFFDLQFEDASFYYSPIFKSMLGYRSSELQDSPDLISKLLHPEEGKQPGSEEVRRLSHTKQSFFRECRLCHKNGRYLWMQINGVIYLDGEGQERRRLGFVTDVTHKKYAQLALASERERLRVTLSSINDAVIATDTMGNIVILNRAAEEWFGIRSEEVLGRPIPQKLFLLNPKTRAPFDMDIDLTTGEGPSDDFKFKGVIIDADGNERTLSRSFSPLRNGEQKVIGTVLIYHDITFSERYSQELIKSSKMESIGILAGGIAHDFNNLLTTILGNISLVRNGLSELDSLGNSEEACMLAKELTQQLLTFSRGGAPVKKTVVVSDLVQKAVRISMTGTTVKAEMNLCTETSMVEVDPGQINQVLQNLLINAVQAMPDGGKIYISLKPSTIADNSPRPLKPGNYIRIDIRDEGMGIPQENLNKIFDPFFTTKTQGTGLGLTTAYSIIRRHYGHMEVTSELGGGTTFSLFLPATFKKNEKTKEAENMLMTGDNSILLMDDDASIREVARLILQKLGYQVTCATKGEEALELYKESLEAGSPFDLVIMDLTIPGHMGGREAMIELLKLDPKCRGLVSSGYSTDPIMSDFSSHGFKGAITKPFRVEELSMAVKKAIGEAGAF